MCLVVCGLNCNNTKDTFKSQALECDCRCHQVKIVSYCMRVGPYPDIQGLLSVEERNNTDTETYKEDMPG